MTGLVAALLLLTGVAGVGETGVVGVGADPVRWDSLGADSEGWDSPFLGSGFERLESWTSTVEPPLGVLIEPVDVRRTLGGDYLVTDRALHRVTRFSDDGEPLDVYGRPGDGDGELFRPTSASEDEDVGLVYVADTGNERIAVFYANGTFAAAWELDQAPTRLAVGLNGLVHTFDERRVYVATYNPEGKFLSEQFFPPQGRSAFGFRDLPGDFDYDDEGRVLMLAGGRLFREAEAPAYVESGSNFERLGAVSRRGIDLASGAGDTHLAMDPERRLHQTDTGSTIVNAPIPGRVHSIARQDDLHILSAVGDSGDLSAGLYSVRLSNTPQVVGRWGYPVTIRDWFGRPLRLATTTDGSVFVRDEYDRLVRVGADGLGLGQARLPGLVDMAAMDPGTVVTYRIVRNQRQALTEDEVPPDGHNRHVIQRWEFGDALVSPPRAAAEGHSAWSTHWDEPVGKANTTIRGVSLAPDGSAAVALDSKGERLLITRVDTGETRSLGLPDLGWGVPGYVDVAVTPWDTLVVVQSSARTLIEIDWTGAELRRDTAPSRTSRLTMMGDSLLLVSADGSRWVQDAAGRFVAHSEPVGASAGIVGGITDVAVDHDGGLVLADYAEPAVHLDAVGHGVPQLPAIRSACDPQIESQLSPTVARVGERVTVTLRLAPSCPEPDANDPTGRAAPLRDVVLRADLTPELAEAASAAQGLELRDGRLTWRTFGVADGGAELTLTVVPTVTGRLPLWSAVQVDFLDGDYRFGAAFFESAPHLVTRDALIQVFLPVGWTQ